MNGAGERQYTEDCCFNYERDNCKGAARCPCKCHEKRMTRQEWQTLKVQDFERLESENTALRARLAESSALVRELEAALDAARRDLVGFRDYLADAGSVTTAQAIQRTLDTVDAALRGAQEEGEPT